MLINKEKWGFVIHRKNPREQSKESQNLREIERKYQRFQQHPWQLHTWKVQQTETLFLKDQFSNNNKKLTKWNQTLNLYHTLQI